jgi:hypothetical protein
LLHKGGIRQWPCPKFYWHWPVRSEQWLMLIYRFTIHNVDGSDREEAGRMALRDDKAARAFGKAMIRDMMSGEAARYAGWIMDITQGERAVWSLPLGH